MGRILCHLVVDEKVTVEYYSKDSGLRVALLLNFQRPKVEWKRVLPDP